MARKVVSKAGAARGSHLHKAKPKRLSNVFTLCTKKWSSSFSRKGPIHSESNETLITPLWPCCAPRHTPFSGSPALRRGLRFRRSPHSRGIRRFSQGRSSKNDDRRRPGRLHQASNLITRRNIYSYAKASTVCEFELIDRPRYDLLKSVLK